MWGDDPERKEPVIISDIPESMPLGTWLTYIGFVLIILLGVIYLYYGGESTPAPAPIIDSSAAVEYRISTRCSLSDNLSCTSSSIEGTATTLIIRNDNPWDIIGGQVTLTSVTRSCEFDGSQTLRLLPSGTTQTLLFVCADGTGYRAASIIENAIKIDYRIDNAPLTRYANGSVIKTVEVVTR